jgi:hypothetical protein
MLRTILITILFSTFAMAAQTYRFADLVEGETYRVDRNIELEYAKTNFQITKGQLLKLNDFKPLPMINVYLAEFDILKCQSPSLSSEMILIEIPQGQSKLVSVGVDLAFGCKLEVFIEKKDYNSKSIFY